MSITRWWFEESDVIPEEVWDKLRPALWFWDWRPSASETLINWGLQLQREEIEEVLNAQR